MNVSVQYDRSLKIGAVGPSAWAKLGPEDWFDNYKVVCANSRQYHADFVIDLGLTADDIEAFKTKIIVESPEFRALANSALSDYRFIVYRPVVVPEDLAADRFVANDIAFNRFENKRIFREYFTGLVPIPAYQQITIDELLAGDASALYERFKAAFKGDFVVQDELSGGGRGTFIVRSAGDMQRAVDILQVERAGDYAIVSEYIDAVERSIQVCIGKDTTVLGPLQQQLVRNPELVNPEGRGGMLFCGGRLVDDASLRVREQVDTLIARLSEVLKSEGYRGVYGVDFLVDASENVYVLEINARTTGMLPLINEQQTAVPLYLLHILELADAEYTVTDDIGTDLQGPKSFVVLFNQAAANVHFDEYITTGNYKFAGDQLVRLDEKARWHPEADVMIQVFCSPDVPAKPNLKLCNIFLKHTGFDTGGRLSDDTSKLLSVIKQHQVQT